MNIVDPDQYNQYKKHTPAIIEKFGGRFLSRGGNITHLEGKPDERRVVLVQFNSIEEVKQFYDSPEYTYAKKLRESAATEMQLMTFEGFEKL